MVLNRLSRKEADGRLALLRRPVNLQVFTVRYEDAACREVRQLAEELAESSSRVAVEVNDAIESGDLLRKFRMDAPASLVVTAKASPEFRFYGLPMGYAYIPFLDVLLSIGQPAEPKDDLLKAVAQAAVKTNGEPVSIRMDLVISRRDATTPEAVAALTRFVHAAFVMEDAPHIVASVRIVEDFPQWTRPLLPTLLLNNESALAWPFTDIDIAKRAAEVL